MYRRRLARTGVILAILCVGCARAGTDHVATADQPAPAATPASVASSPPPPPATVATDVPAPNPTVASEVTPAADPPAPTPPPQPAAVVQVGAHTVTTQPAPAEIVVQYAPHDGGTATASLQETGDTQSLASGSALFAGLADGTYTVQIDVVYPTESSGNSGIGAETVFRTHGVAVHAGDHVVISCDDNACTGIS